MFVHLYKWVMFQPCSGGTALCWLARDPTDFSALQYAANPVLNLIRKHSVNATAAFMEACWDDAAGALWQGAVSCWRPSRLKQTPATAGHTWSAAVPVYAVAAKGDLPCIIRPVRLQKTLIIRLPACTFVTRKNGVNATFNKNRESSPEQHTITCPRLKISNSNCKQNCNGNREKGYSLFDWLWWWMLDYF